MLIAGFLVVIIIEAVLISVFVENRKNNSETEITTTQAVILTDEEEKEITEIKKQPQTTAVNSGSCGEYADWVYDESKKKLEITGEGTVDDPSGWKDFAHEVESVWVGKGITDFEIDVFNSLINAEDFYFASVSREKYDEFKKSDYYLNRAGRENGVLYKSDVLIEVDPSITGVFRVKDGTTDIGNCAFSGSAVKKVIVPDSVTSIGLCAFVNCNNLEELSLGSGLKDMNTEFLFVTEGTEINPEMGAPSLKRITVSESNKHYSSQDGVLYNKYKTTLFLYPSAREDNEFTVPDSVMEIAESAFTNTVTLEKVYIGKNVKYMDIFSMMDCNYEGYDYENSKFRVNFEIYYEGTEEEWREVSADAFPEDFFDPPTVYFNCKTFEKGGKAVDYMSAYNEYLKKYNRGKYGEEFRFELCYFTDDNIPELFISEGTWHNAPVEILTYSDGKVKKLFEGGAFGRIEYVEYGSLVLINDYRNGYESGTLIRVDNDGTSEKLFSHYNNKEYAEKNGEKKVFNVNGENVSEREYDRQVEWELQPEFVAFEEGVLMTAENIDKYCK